MGFETFNITTPNCLFDILYTKPSFSTKNGLAFGLTTPGFKTTVYSGYQPKSISAVSNITIDGVKGFKDGKVIYDLSCIGAQFISNFALIIKTPTIRVKNSINKRVEVEGYILWKIVFALDDEVRTMWTLAINSGEARERTLTAFPDAEIVSITAQFNRTPRYQVCWSNDLAEHLTDMNRLFRAEDDHNYIYRDGIGHNHALYLINGKMSTKLQAERHSDFRGGCVTSAIDSEPGFKNVLKSGRILLDLKYGDCDEQYSFPLCLAKGTTKLEVSFLPFSKFLIIKREVVDNIVYANSTNVIISDDPNDINLKLLEDEFPLEIQYSEGDEVSYETITRDLTLDDCEFLDEFIDVQSFVCSSVVPPRLSVRGTTVTPTEISMMKSLGYGTTGISSLYMSTNVRGFHVLDAVCPGRTICFPNIMQDLCPDDSIRGIVITAKRITDIAQGDFGYKDDESEDLLDWARLMIKGSPIYADKDTSEIDTMFDLAPPGFNNFLLISFVNDLDDKNDTAGSWPVSVLQSAVCGIPLYIKVKDKSEIGDIPVVVTVNILINNLTAFESEI